MNESFLVHSGTDFLAPCRSLGTKAGIPYTWQSVCAKRDLRYAGRPGGEKQTGGAIRIEKYLEKPSSAAI